MIGSVFLNSLAQVTKLAKSLPSAASTLGGLAKQSLQGDSGWPKMPTRLAQADGSWTTFERKGTFFHGLIYLDPARSA